MLLPDEIHEIRRWQPEPGDILIFQNHEIEITPEDAAAIEAHVRRKLRIPANVRIAVIGRDWEFTVGKAPE